MIEAAPCPLLIIPEGKTQLNWKHLANASDFILEDCEGLLFMQSWLPFLKARLTCFHISTNRTEMEGSRKKMSILERLFPQEYISFHIEEGIIEPSIDLYIDKEQVDLIALTHKDRTFWNALFQKSISQAIASDVTIPMLLFQHNS